MKNILSTLLVIIAISSLGFSSKDTAGQNTEFMEPGKMRINGKFPLMTSVLKFDQIFGKPDSITRITDWDGICQSGIRDKYSTCRHYGGSTFESYNDSLSAKSIDFTKGSKFFVQYGKLRLDGNSTRAQLQKLYLESFKETQMVTTDGFTGMLEQVSIPMAKELEIESMWVLLFQKGKLVRIDYWLPC